MASISEGVEGRPSFETLGGRKGASYSIEEVEDDDEKEAEAEGTDASVLGLDGEEGLERVPTEVKFTDVQEKGNPLG